MLAHQGLNVPKPVLGRVERRGLFVGLALITERVPGRPLLDVLESLQEHRAFAVLRKVGAVLGRMHETGFRHRDLHPGNILVREDGEIVVIDLASGGWGGQRGDRSALRSLVRMARYIEKHAEQAATLRQVIALLQGYEPRRDAQRELMRHLLALYSREMIWHRALWFLRGTKSR